MLKLIDYENLTQEESTASMNISCRTVWQIFQGACKSVIIAIVSGSKYEQISIK